jgi:hypothetical protein
MTNKETEELSSDEEAVQLDIDKVRANLPQYSSEKLCEMVVCDRYFSIDKQISVMCMQELATRRIAGNDFAFEKYIEEAHSKLPPLDFSMPDLRVILSQVIKAGKK